MSDLAPYNSYYNIAQVTKRDEIGGKGVIADGTVSSKISYFYTFVIVCMVDTTQRATQLCYVDDHER